MEGRLDKWYPGFRPRNSVYEEHPTLRTCIVRSFWTTRISRISDCTISWDTCGVLWQRLTLFKKMKVMPVLRVWIHPKLVKTILLVFLATDCNIYYVSEISRFRHKKFSNFSFVSRQIVLYNLFFFKELSQSSRIE